MPTARGRLAAAIAGTSAVAICCFTPILVLVLTAMGLGALTGYIDYVLIPALVLMLFVTWRAYGEYARPKRPKGAR
jgi:mercuric ion transport protein